MIIGSGLIASEFFDLEENNSIVIFASGVSNSLETKNEKFKREEQLITNTINKYNNSLFVYFSTCSINDNTINQRPYVLHKLKMEDLIINSAENYLIVRLSNIVGKGGNKNTLFNYLVNAIKDNSNIHLWKNASRNILDIEDMGKVVRDIIKSGTKNTILNIANPNSYPVNEIVVRIEKHLQKTANLTIIEKGSHISIEINKTMPYIENLSKDFSINYIDELLRKYH